MTERMSEDDLAMLRAAIDAMREPQAALAFVQREIARRYKLTQSDQVDAVSGEIVRGTTTNPLTPHP
jgi:hypothetical protein